MINLRFFFNISIAPIGSSCSLPLVMSRRMKQNVITSLGHRCKALFRVFIGCWTNTASCNNVIASTWNWTWIANAIKEASKAKRYMIDASSKRNRSSALFRSSSSPAAAESRGCAEKNFPFVYLHCCCRYEPYKRAQRRSETRILYHTTYLLLCNSRGSNPRSTGMTDTHRQLASFHKESAYSITFIARCSHNFRDIPVTVTRTSNFAVSLVFFFSPVSITEYRDSQLARGY